MSTKKTVLKRNLDKVDDDEIEEVIDDTTDDNTDDDSTDDDSVDGTEDLTLDDIEYVENQVVSIEETENIIDVEQMIVNEDRIAGQISFLLASHTPPNQKVKHNDLIHRAKLYTQILKQINTGGENTVRMQNVSSDGFGNDSSHFVFPTVRVRKVIFSDPVSDEELKGSKLKQHYDIEHCVISTRNKFLQDIANGRVIQDIQHASQYYYRVFAPFDQTEVGTYTPKSDHDHIYQWVDEKGANIFETIRLLSASTATMPQSDTLAFKYTLYEGDKVQWTGFVTSPKTKSDKITALLNNETYNIFDCDLYRNNIEQLNKGDVVNAYFFDFAHGFHRLLYKCHVINVSTSSIVIEEEGSTKHKYTFDKINLEKNACFIYHATKWEGYLFNKSDLNTECIRFVNARPQDIHFVCMTPRQHLYLMNEDLVSFNLDEMERIIPGIRDASDTTQYLKKAVEKALPPRLISKQHNKSKGKSKEKQSRGKSQTNAKLYEPVHVSGILKHVQQRQRSLIDLLGVWNPKSSAKSQKPVVDTPIRFPKELKRVFTNMHAIVQDTVQSISSPEEKALYVAYDDVFISKDGKNDKHVLEIPRACILKRVKTPHGYMWDKDEASTKNLCKDNKTPNLQYLVPALREISSELHDSLREQVVEHTLHVKTKLNAMIQSMNALLVQVKIEEDVKSGWVRVPGELSFDTGISYQLYQGDQDDSSLQEATKEFGVFYDKLADDEDPGADSLVVEEGIRGEIRNIARVLNVSINDAHVSYIERFLNTRQTAGDGNDLTSDAAAGLYKLMCIFAFFTIFSQLALPNKLFQPIERYKPRVFEVGYPLMEDAKDTSLVDYFAYCMNEVIMRFEDFSHLRTRAYQTLAPKLGAKLKGVIGIILKSTPYLRMMLDNKLDVIQQKLLPAASKHTNKDTDTVGLDGWDTFRPIAFSTSFDMPNIGVTRMNSPLWTTKYLLTLQKVVAKEKPLHAGAENKPLYRNMCCLNRLHDTTDFWSHFLDKDADDDSDVKELKHMHQQLVTMVRNRVSQREDSVKLSSKPLQRKSMSHGTNVQTKQEHETHETLHMATRKTKNASATHALESFLQQNDLHKHDSHFKALARDGNEAYFNQLEDIVYENTALLEKYFTDTIGIPNNSGLNSIRHFLSTDDEMPNNIKFMQDYLAVSLPDILSKCANNFQKAEKHIKRRTFIDGQIRKHMLTAYTTHPHMSAVEAFNQFRDVNGLKAMEWLLKDGLRDAGSIIHKGRTHSDNALIFCYMILRCIFILIHGCSGNDVSRLAAKHLYNLDDTDHVKVKRIMPVITHILQYLDIRYQDVTLTPDKIMAEYEIEREKRKSNIMKTLEKLEDDDRKLTKRLMDIKVYNKDEVIDKYTSLFADDTVLDELNDDIQKDRAPLNVHNIDVDYDVIDEDIEDPEDNA
jgi:hypothetical protein